VKTDAAESAMKPSLWVPIAALLMSLAAGMPALADAGEAPDALIQRVSSEVVGSAREQALDGARIVTLVDTTIMPNVDFVRMTASAVGRSWRQATPEQQARLQEEFKSMLVRTYAATLTQLKDQTVQVKPLRAAADDTEVIVRTTVRGRGDPIPIDYRMHKSAAGWKIYDLNVLGVWLVDTYRGQFAGEINARGIDGLIALLSERNHANRTASR
jgi:phospholipid transport system substrate-binding protein